MNLDHRGALSARADAMIQGMTTDSTDVLHSALQAAKTDLAFALAQGDGLAEDEAARRVAELTKKIEQDAK